MAKLTHRLDDVQLRHWVAQRIPLAKSDGDGLTFTLSAAGTASWILRYRIGNNQRREITIGNYPDLSLTEARKKAQRLRVLIDDGKDPAFDKQKEKARSHASWLIRDLVADYRENVLKPEVYSDSTIKYRGYDFDQVILPKLGHREVRDINTIDLVYLLKNLKRSWLICKRIRTGIGQLMDHAIAHGIIQSNPVTGIKLTALRGKRPAVRKRIMLSRDDLSTLLRSADDIGRQNALALKILLATCVRGVELVKAKWEHLDFDRATWWIPEDSVKTRSGFLVPLAPTVIHWFQELKALAGDSSYVLPARRSDRIRGGDNHVGRTTLWAAITRAFRRGELEVTRFTPHDTRSTAKSHMRNLGVSREVSEIALNHKLEGMEGIYDVREEIPERRTALERWAAFLVECETGAPPVPTASVVNFPFRRMA